MYRLWKIAKWKNENKMKWEAEDTEFVCRWMQDDEEEIFYLTIKYTSIAYIDKKLKKYQFPYGQPM